MSSDASPPAPDGHRFWRSVGVYSGVALALLVGLEFTTLDLALARWMYDPAQHRFPWNDHWLTTRLAHDVFRLAAAAGLIGLLIGLWRPFGILRRLSRPRRIYLLGAAILCLVVVGLLKRISAAHCPWDLVEFGGTQAYLRLFDAAPPDWHRGACFPAGHALTGFSFVGGYFAWQGRDSRIARRWLAMAVVLGGLAGLSQQLRGAHFLSHTLWTLWLCWTLSAALAWAFRGPLHAPA